MNILLLLVAALLPVVLLLLYIWKKDPIKEPTSWLVKAVVWGAAMCIPVAFIEVGVQTALFGEGGPTSLIDTTTMAFLVAALPEEACKLLVLWWLLRKNPYFDEHVDGIVYAVFVGLGFAAIENVSYLLDGGDDWAGVAVSRALLAVPGHYAFAILMGYYYSLYHFVDRSKKTAVLCLLVPFVAHGIYDALAMSSLVNPVVGGLCFFVLIYFCVKMHKVAKRKLEEQLVRDAGESPESPSNTCV